MPRGPRVDAPGAVHHVMVRGIERREIFRDDCDRRDLLDRLARILPEAGMSCLAWAFMPNHLHFVLRTGPVPLSRVMARLNTGYARRFNERHDRVGHLFQNRFGSRLAGDDADLLGLVRYVHRNPLRAGIVAGLEALQHYPWTGHSALLGARSPHAFESVSASLALWSRDFRTARRRLREWMGQGEPIDELPPLPPATSGPRAVSPTAPASDALDALIRDVCRRHDIPVEELFRGRGSRRVSEARAEIVADAVRSRGLPISAVARALGLSLGGASRALGRACPGRRSLK